MIVHVHMRVRVRMLAAISPFAPIEVVVYCELVCRDLFEPHETSGGLAATSSMIAFLCLSLDVALRSAKSCGASGSFAGSMKDDIRRWRWLSSRRALSMPYKLLRRKRAGAINRHRSCR